MGDTARMLVMRYDHGPSRMEPSSPIVFFSVGRTMATDVEPVMPNTVNATAASNGLSLQDGRCCVVHSQKSAIQLLLLPPLLVLLRYLRCRCSRVTPHRSTREASILMLSETAPRQRRLFPTRPLTVPPSLDRATATRVPTSPQKWFAARWLVAASPSSPSGRGLIGS